MLMEIPQLRPACRHSDSELLITIDTVEAARDTLDSYRLELLADLDSRGLTRELGAKDTTELPALRCIWLLGSSTSTTDAPSPRWW
ncbi:hypothetical protein GCM10022235_47150 [Kribbella ginsengisoli]|uniref:Uncharacterized protein n=2 Tax=Kribbella ginsengisoli TaxID=363865 RepID=A0ABP6XUB1_9ACTN